MIDLKILEERFDRLFKEEDSESFETWLIERENENRFKMLSAFILNGVVMVPAHIANFSIPIKSNFIDSDILKATLILSESSETGYSQAA